jgi:integrase
MGLTKSIPYAFQKRGVFYFSRRVPSDLQRHYQKDRIVISLRTGSARAANVKAQALASRLDEEWLTLRWTSRADPLERFRSDAGNTGVSASDAPLLSEASRIYLSVKAAKRPKTFSQAVEREVRNLISLRGDKPIDTYSRSDANAFRDAMLTRGLQLGSVKRAINTIRALVNFVAKEQGLADVSAFSGVYLDREAEPESTRQPIPLEVIRVVQRTCRSINDEPRWLIALVSDTGMRLAEAAGLTKDDIQLEGPYPHVTVQPHPWRRLKTKASQRQVPLVGEALWAVQQAKAHAKGRFLFPKYCSESGCNANSASAALNKWLKPRVPNGCVMHSFRHSFRDRLRAVECPPPIMDRLGGWALEGVGEGYGQGYGVEVLNHWIAKLMKCAVATDVVDKHDP